MEIPQPVLPLTRLIIGSDTTGQMAAGGQFEELATFAGAYPAWPLAIYYQAMRWHADLGTYRVESTLSRDSSGRLNLASVPEPPGGGGGGTNQLVPAYPATTNGLRLAKPVLTNGTIYLTILGGTNNAAYDLFATAAVTSNSLAHSTWRWLGAGQNSNTYAFSGQTNAAAFYLFGTPLDGDNDGLSDAWETLISRSCSTNSDSDGDGLPDGWEWKHFGNFTNTGAGDFDQDGLSNAQEYQFNGDPNNIASRLRFASFYSAQGTVTGAVELLAGVPSQMAVLLDNTNFAGATWSACQTNFTASLGGTQGWHNVWVGLRGRATNSESTWNWQRIKLDSLPPTLLLSNPTTNLVSKPMIQVKGFSPEPLASLTFTATNSLGEVQSGRGLLVDSAYDTNQMAFTTNWFECLDIALTAGTNRLSLRAVDRAGNVTITNFVFRFDITGDTSAPVVTLTWPLTGMKLSGDSFTVRGTVDDETVSIKAQVFGGGATNAVDGYVERNGRFWIENLPLASGTNSVVITATDAAGNIATASLTLIRSSLALNITPVEESLLHNLTTTVSGTISDSSHAVWVNGVPANVNSGTWSANEVPINTGCTASFLVTAYPPGDDPGAPTGSGTNPQTANAVNMELSQDKPPRVFVENYDLRYSSLVSGYTWLRFVPVVENQWLRWEELAGGQSHYVSAFHPGAPPDLFWSTNQVQWPVDVSPPNLSGTNSLGNPVAAPSLPVEQCEAFGASRFLNTVDYTIDTAAYQRTAQTTVKLFTGGKDLPGQQSLFSLRETLMERGWVWNFGGGEGYDLPAIEPSRVMLGAYGPLDASNMVYTALADGTEVDITPIAQGIANQGGQLPSATKHILHITANGIILRSDNLFTNAEFCVGQKVVFNYLLIPPLPDLSVITSESHFWWLPPSHFNAKEEWNSSSLYFELVTCYPVQRSFSRHKESGEDVSQPCTNYLTLPSLLTIPATGCWWASPGQKQVKLWWSVQIRNQQPLSLDGKGLLSVVSPSIASNTWYCSGVHLYFTTNGFLRELALKDSNDTGLDMTIYVTRPTNFIGSVYFTQLINRNLSYNTTASSYSESTGGFWLDKDNPYYGNMYTFTIPGNSTRPMTFFDIPGIIEGTFPFLDRVEVKDDFMLFLRFIPSGSDSIPVTLSQINWGWHGKAIATNGWALTLTNRYGPTFISTNNVPVWKKVYHDN